MAIRIHEALQLPIMQQTKLIAGQNGLQNWIKWVTIVEVIEDINRLQEGEFLITTGFGLGENEEKQKEFKRLLSLGKLSGVALYTGLYLREIPQSFISIADQYALPLIEIPANINFSMITKELLEQIINKQSQTFEYSLRIHQNFTSLVLEHQGFDPITKTLSNMIQASVILTQQEEVKSFHTIHAFIDAVNPKQEQKENFVYYTQPIAANKNIYGEVLVIKEKDRWEDLDSIAIEHATTVYAIEFLRRKAVEEAQIRLARDFLEELLNQPIIHPTDIIERGKKLGIDLTRPHAIFSISISASIKENVKEQLGEAVYSLFKQTKVPFLMRTKSDSVIVLLEAGDGQRIVDRAGEMLKSLEMNVKAVPISIGIGKTVTSIDRLAESARQAEQAAQLSKILFKPKPIVRFEDLSLYQLLLDMKESKINLEDFYQQHLGSILNTRGVDLITTLEAYLYFNQNIKKTADELFIHRHTLKYRLGQIEKKTGANLSSFEDCTKLYLAIMAYKLVNFAKREIKL